MSATNPSWRRSLNQRLGASRKARQRRRSTKWTADQSVEVLEARVVLSTSIIGSVTLDESPGLQTNGVAVPGGEDNNDNDVALSQLPPSFSNRLFGSPAAGLGLSSTFATAAGAAKSADNYITVTSDGTVVSLGFAAADGSALP